MQVCFDNRDTIKVDLSMNNWNKALNKPDSFPPTVMVDHVHGDEDSLTLAEGGGKF